MLICDTNNNKFNYGAYYFVDTNMGLKIKSSEQINILGVIIKTENNG